MVDTLSHGVLDFRLNPWEKLCLMRLEQPLKLTVDFRVHAQLKDIEAWSLLATGLELSGIVIFATLVFIFLVLLLATSWRHQSSFFLLLLLLLGHSLFFQALLLVLFFFSHEVGALEDEVLAGVADADQLDLLAAEGILLSREVDGASEFALQVEDQEAAAIIDHDMSIADKRDEVVMVCAALGKQVQV